MSTIPSPVFIYGDATLAKKDLVRIKAKYADREWVEMSLEENTPDQIRMEAGMVGFGSTEKILVLKDLPNLKAIREFLLDLSKRTRKDVTIVIWDSNEVIKSDPKTRVLNDTWTDFISQIKEISGHKILSFGDDFVEKEEQDVVKYIQSLFAKYGKQIPYDAAKLMSTIVGGKRSLLVSEVEKLCLIAPTNVDQQFIVDNTYPITQEAVLWKFGNIIDEGNFANSIVAMKQYLQDGVHANVLSEILCKKARWQLAVCYLWSTGMSLYDVEQYILRMGKFPSAIWQTDGSSSEKKARSDKLKEPLAAIEWFTREMGLPDYYFNELKVKGAKVKGGEAIPMPFMAQVLIKFIQDKIILPNSKKCSLAELRPKVLERAVKTYALVTDGMKNMRYNSLFEQELYEMIRALSDFRV